MRRGGAFNDGWPGGPVTGVVHQPGSAAEVAEAVRGAELVVPRGGGTKPPLAVVDGAEVLDRLSGLSGITEYLPSEYTVTALAGTPLAEVEARPRRRRPVSAVRSAARGRRQHGRRRRGRGGQRSRPAALRRPAGLPARGDLRRRPGRESSAAAPRSSRMPPASTCRSRHGRQPGSPGRPLPSARSRSSRIPKAAPPCASPAWRWTRPSRPPAA